MVSGKVGTEQKTLPDPNTLTLASTKPDMKEGCSPDAGGVAKEFTEDIDVLGLKFLCRESTHVFRKLMYLVLVLFGCGFATFQIVDQVSCFSLHRNSCTENLVEKVGMSARKKHNERILVAFRLNSAVLLGRVFPLWKDTHVSNCSAMIFASFQGDNIFVVASQRQDQH